MLREVFLCFSVPSRKDKNKAFKQDTNASFHIHFHFSFTVLLGWDGMDWIDLAQDRDQWRALVNTVMDLRVP
jgi:hypothetical protein